MYISHRLISSLYSYIFMLLLFVLLGGCDRTQQSSISYENSKQKTWVYLEIKSKGEETDYRYYLYGEIKKQLFFDISNNVIESGFFMISDVKYYDDNNLVANYADDLYTGTLVFRIEDIQMIKELKKAPDVGLGPNEIEPIDSE
jgi:protease II